MTAKTKQSTFLPKNIGAHPPILTQLERTCCACPSQWEGLTDDGNYVYIRYRGGRLRADVAKTRFQWAKGVKIQLFGQVVGEPLDGYMTDEEMKVALRGVLDFSHCADFKS